MLKNSLSTKLSLGLLALALGASVASAEPVSVNIRVGVRPPPVRHEFVPAPRHGYMWAPGYWGWSGGAHVWMEGHWEAEHPGYRYIGARWVLVGPEWVFYPAYWEPLPAPVVIAPTPIVVQQAAPVYIEQPQPAADLPAQFDPNFWYYCHNPAGYYPYVKECGGGWQKVTPVPTGAPSDTPHP
ncbi:MAG: YXWGXW repeat-containing protein [Burkholderiaceae bacterium]|nr:YXWGXW repeat-containing protein [Burkholderiaceae bacterium]